jgi:ABC-type Fe3+-hydroxamate transport system substrate-binding protein
MKCLRPKTLLMFVTILLLAGCGGGSNGNLTVTGSTSGANNSSSATFVITYANSQVTDYQGLQVQIYTTDSTNGILENDTITLTSSGTQTITYTNVPPNSSVTLRAQTSSIVSSATVAIPASVLTVSPTLNFTTGEAVGSKLSTPISGGVPPYSASSSTADILAGISGNNLTVEIENQNTSGTTETATITIKDDAGNSATVTVNY